MLAVSKCWVGGSTADHSVESESRGVGAQLQKVRMRLDDDWRKEETAPNAPGVRLTALMETF